MRIPLNKMIIGRVYGEYTITRLFRIADNKYITDSYPSLIFTITTKIPYIDCINEK